MIELEFLISVIIVFAFVLYIINYQPDPYIEIENNLVHYFHLSNVLTATS